MVYRPPPRSNSGETCNRIKEFINNIPDLEKKDLILLDDFNWDASDESGQGISFIDDIASEFGLVQLIKGPTRVGKSRE